MNFGRWYQIYVKGKDSEKAIMKKIICITGGRGSGKTTAAVTYPPPDEIEQLCVFDCEDSTSDLLHMGFTCVRLYDKLRIGGDMLDRLAKGEIPWVDQQGRNALIQYYEYFVETLNTVLVNGKYKYFAIDTVEPIEAAMTAAVESGRRVFGWSGTRAYGRMETEGVRPLYAGLMEAVAQRGVEHILLTSHLKGVWLDDKPVPGKVKPGGRLKVLSRLSSAMFWLVAGDDASGAPAALVLKARMGKVEAVNGKWQVRRVLPERIPSFTWDAVDGYKENPANLANPAPNEIMSSDEREMIGELLSDEQMRLMVLSAEQRVAEARGRGMLVQPQGKTDSVDVVDDNDIDAFITAGKSNAEIVKTLGVSLPAVLKARKEMGE
jgi:hypothetical protein